MFNHNDVLKNVSESHWLIMKNYLENKGYFHDEFKDIYLSTPVMEKYADEIETYLRKFGYHGGALFTTGKIYPGHGAVYAIFDTNRLDIWQIHKELDFWVDNYNNN
jgi:hypothetical protein